MSATFDTLLLGGTVYDGSGAPEKRADVALAGDRIAAVGDLAGAAARRVVDAAGLAVAPGFIDVHTHSDAHVLVEPDAAGKIAQGVTTEIVGQCGASLAPFFGRRSVPADWTAVGVPGCPTFADYRGQVERVRPAVNVVAFAGHNALRAGVMGYEPRPATADEVAAMARHLEQALDEGASGLSTGLIYQPGRYATTDEIVALARVAAGRGGLYASHMRSESGKLLEAIDETLAIGRATGIRLQISHLKTSGEDNWGKLDDALERVRQARRQGLIVHGDRYPYTASWTDLDIVLPEWSVAGGRDAILARLAEPATAARMASDMDAKRPPDAWSSVRIGGTVHPDLRPLRGRTVAEVAAERGIGGGQAVVWILTRDELRTSAFFFGMSEANMRRVFAEPWVMVGSDASIERPTGPLAARYPHPRAYGTFPRFLRLVQDEHLMPLSEALRRCTSLAADAFGLPGRGRIAAGAFADVVVFDPAAVRDVATFGEPQQFAAGVRQVWTNGRLGYDNGRFTGDRGGVFLQSRF